MNGKELMRRGCAIFTSVVLVVCYPGNIRMMKVNAKADEKNYAVGSETESESIEQEWKSSVVDEIGHKGKKAYIVKAKTKADLLQIQKQYSESGEINKNGDDFLRDKKTVSVELSEDQADVLSDHDTISFLEEDKVVEASSNFSTEKKKYTHLKDKKPHDKKVKNIAKNTSSTEWNVRMIKAKDKAVNDSNRIKVAILDSGIDWGNDIDLAYQVSLVPGEEEMTQIFMDGSGHGTSVASLLAATDNNKGITGINSNVDIYSYRVLDDGNKAPVSRVIEAIYMAIDQNVNIINMSFGLDDYSEALEEAIHAAKKKGILMIAAAGNTGAKGVQYPAAFDEVIVVGAVNKDGTVEDYSAKGEEVELVAPGELVRTTGFINSQEVTSGTSLAAPQVTAVATLIWQKDPSVSADFVRGLLNESANLYGKTDEYGNGLVDAEYALSHYEEYKNKYRDSSQEDKDNQRKAKQFIAENKDEIITFSDSGCVKGSWLGDDHVAMIDSAKYCVRVGARFPDTDDDHGIRDEYFGKKTSAGDSRVFAGMEPNPWWHGYYTTNYFKATIYATCMAKSVGDGGAHENVASWLNYNNAAQMDADINFLYKNGEAGWNHILNWLKANNSSASNQKNTNGFKRAVLWGMAIHTATDVYAHSTELWGERIKHDRIHSLSIPDADNKKYRERRYRDASVIASRMMAKYSAGEYSLSTSDLQVQGCCTIGYKIINYVEYISQVDAGCATYSYTYNEGTK